MLKYPVSGCQTTFFFLTKLLWQKLVLVDAVGHFLQQGWV